MNKVAARITKIIGSRLFFWGIVGFLVFEALWIALSAVYPMAFDEDFHLGIIQIYAHQWSPFLSGQPPGADAYSAVARDPSYLYHYLMSFPYRALTHITANQTAQIIGLRLINIGLFASSLVVFRKVLLRAGLSRALTQAALALFVLIPVVPLLAAQINYDNLLMLLIGWTCLLVYDVYDGLRYQQLHVVKILLLCGLCLFASVVKYPFLPVALAAFIFLLGMYVRHFRGQRQLVKRQLIAVWQHTTRWTKVGLGLFLLCGLLLFGQRYAVNAIEYHTPLPACDAVLSDEECSAYGPWERNHTLAAVRGSVDKNPVHYLGQWLAGMWTRLFFMVNGPASLYATRKPMPIPGTTAIAIGLLGILALVIWWKRVFRGRAYLGFFLGMIVLYCGALLLDNYSQYLETGQVVAVNGRYLLPLLLPAAALAGMALSYGLRRAALLKPAMAVLAIVLFLQGGGVIAFIVRSDDSWDWHNATVQRINDDARAVLKPVIIEGPDR